MASRSVVLFEVRPSAGCTARSPSPCYRTFRYVFKERQLLNQGRRSVIWSTSPCFRVHASTDSAESELASEPVLAEPAEQSDPATAAKPTEPTTPSIPQIPPRKDISELKVGDVLDAVVKSVVKFGCFLDAHCTLDVFVHVSDFSNTFVRETSDFLSVSDKVKVELIDVTDRLKGSLKNHNELGSRGQGRELRRPRRGGPQKRETRTYSPAETFEGVVERVMPNGAFVKFDDGKASGFLPLEHINKATDMDNPQTRAFDVLNQGDTVSIRVLSTEGTSGKLRLTMKSLEEIEDARRVREEGFSIKDEGDETAILSAALKKAGIIREMFTDSKEETLRKIQQVKEVKAVAETTQLVEEAAVVQEELAADEQPEPPTEAVAGVEDEIPEPGIEAVEESEPEEPPEMDEKPEMVAEAQQESESAVPEATEEEPILEPKLEPVAELEDVPEPEPVVTAEVEVPEPEPVVSAEELEEPQAVAEIQKEEAEPEKPADVEAPVPEAVTEALKETPPAEPEPEPEPVPVEEQQEPVREPAAATEVKPVEETKKGAPAATNGEPALVITASMVKELRETSGAGMMDCKKALKECNASMDAAMDYLKQKGIASAAKRAGKVASEGLIASYIHTGAKLGILLEVNSETDFVARTEAFKRFVDDVALTIAASPDAICISPDDYPSDVLEKEKAVEMGKEDILSKPESIREKIVVGRLEKLKKTGAVLEQPFIQDQKTTVQTQLTELSAGLGEKISIRRFARFELGEGLEKKSTDFASEVADQIETKKAEAATKPEPTPTETPPTDKPVVKVAASLVKELRQQTGGGLMDCKKALAECDCDLERAAEYLRQKGLAGAAKKASRLASEGAICSYIHLGSKLGIMAEVNCETDFVSRGEDFKLLADDIAMQLAACPEVEYISAEDIPAEALAAELQSELQKEDLESKPEAIREKIAQGRVDKSMKTKCLLEQPCLKDSTKTIGDLVKEHIATLGENIKVRRFVRFNLGEGIEKAASNFAEEVAEQMNKAS